MPNAKTKAETNARNLRSPIVAAKAKVAETYQKQHEKLKAKAARLEVELATRDNALSKANDAYNKALADLMNARIQLADIEDALGLKTEADE